MDFARARHIMVEGQVRTADVTDIGVLAAMRALPREVFAPPALKSFAYADVEWEIAPGRCALRPRDLAKMLQAVTPGPDDKALEIAGGTGYGAAILSRMTRETHLLEPDPSLAFAARAALEEAGVRGVTVHSTPVREGWPDAAPYDVIVLNGATEIAPPQPWLHQLAEGGRLAVIVRDGAAGALRVYVKTGGVISFRTVFDAAPPVTPGLAQPPRFVF